MVECPRCGGCLLNNYGERECLNCGYCGTTLTPGELKRVLTEPVEFHKYEHEPKSKREVA